MRLINIKNNYVIATKDQENHIEIKDSSLKQSFLKKGIQIPAFMQAQYENKEFIKLKDRDFSKAFDEVYYAKNMDHKIFRWVPD